jgi:nucleoside-diphosphate-sugar epimerase
MTEAGKASSEGTILITGGGGLIGGDLARRLLKQGRRVAIIDIAAPGEGSLPYLGVADHPGLTYIRGSVLNAETWKNTPADVTRIVHAAAILGIERVPREQVETMDATILGTRMCMQFVAALPRLERFIYLSTSEIYGPHAVGVDEAAPALVETSGGRWCYAAAKLSAEFYVKAFAARSRTPYVIVRPFNVYGPAPTCSGALTTLARRAVANETLNVSGTGEQTRAWCHVSDFTDGLMSCLFHDAACEQTFNLGSDENMISIFELAKLICARAESHSKVVISGSGEPDVLDRRPDMSKARKLLGFRLRTSLDDGVEDILRWVSAASQDGL